MTLLLVALAFPVVQQHRSDRSANRLALCAEPAGAGAGRYTCGLLGTAVVDTWRGRALDRQLVTDPHAPVPPGLTSVPKPGEVALSPALLKLYRQPGNGWLRNRLPGRLTQVISRTGLLQPDELVAYIGTAAPVGVKQQVVGYDRGLVVTPNNQTDLVSTNPAAKRKALFAAAVLVLLLIGPIVLFLASCSRLAAQTRQRRLRALRLLGLSSTQVQIVQSAETAAATLAGSLVGVAAFTLARSLLTFRLGSYEWFPGDAEPPLIQIVALVVAMPVAAVAINVLATRRATGVLSSARVRTRTRRLSPLRLIPLLIGVGLLAYVAAAPSPTPDQRNQTLLQITIAALVLVLVGLVVATPLLTQLVAAQMGNRGKRLTTLLAGRGLQAEPAAAARVVTSLVLLVFISVFGQSVLAGIRTQVNRNVFSATLMPNVYASSYFQTPTDGTALENIPGVRRVIPINTLQAPTPSSSTPKPTHPSSGGIITGSAPPAYTAQVLSCHDLALLFKQPPVGCTNTVSYLGDADPSRQGARPTRLTLTAPGATGAPLEVAAPRTTSDVVRFPDARVLTTAGPIGATYLIPPGLVPPADRKAQQLLVITDGDPTTLEQLQAAATQLDPLVTFSAETTREDEYSLSIYQPLVEYGSIIMLTVALAAIAVAAIDRASERKQSIAMQMAIGVPRPMLQCSQILQVMVPYAIGVLLATGVGFESSRSYQRAGGFGLTAATDTVVTTATITVLGAFIISISCLPALGTRKTGRSPQGRADDQRTQLTR